VCDRGSIPLASFSRASTLGGGILNFIFEQVVGWEFFIEGE
jgi:hypothetical protein